MPALIFNTCCGCIELRTGSLIIGYLNLVIDIIYIVLGIVGLAAAVTLANDSDPKTHEVGGMVMAILGITLIVMFLFLGFIITLLVGIHKNKRGHVKAYLIFALICTILSVLSFLAVFGGGYGVGDIISKLIFILLNIYFLLVIRSYYYKMDTAAVPSYNTA